VNPQLTAGIGAPVGVSAGLSSQLGVLNGAGGPQNQLTQNPFLLNQQLGAMGGMSSQLANSQLGGVNSGLALGGLQAVNPQLMGGIGIGAMNQQMINPQLGMLRPNPDAPIGPPAGQQLAPAMKATLDSMLVSLKSRLPVSTYEKVQRLVDNVQQHKVILSRSQFLQKFESIVSEKL